MSEYSCKRVNRWTIEVSKWDGGKAPVAIYTLRGDPGKYVCDCPAGQRGVRCKHVRLTTEWVTRGEPHLLFFTE